MRIELRNIKKGPRSINEYMFRIKALVDSLNNIGDYVSPQEQLGVILNGLPREYESIFTLISSHFEPFHTKEVDALLLAHEVRLEKYKEYLISDTVSANVVVKSDSILPTPQFAPVPQVNIAQNNQPQRLRLCPAAESILQSESEE